MTTIYAESADTGRKRVETATVGVLIALSASHMLNDVMQSLAPAMQTRLKTLTPASCPVGVIPPATRTCWVSSHCVAPAPIEGSDGNWARAVKFAPELPAV